MISLKDSRMELHYSVLQNRDDVLRQIVQLLVYKRFPEEPNMISLLCYLQTNDEKT